MATARKEATIPTREEVLERARAIAPKLRERAEACDAARVVPVETIEDYREAGLFRLAMPRRYSGYEMGWDVLCRISQILAIADCSQAWIQRIMADHAQMVATFPAEAQEEVWHDNKAAIIAAAFDPVGRARRVPGGFRFSGKHGFSSGVDYADWLICGGYIEDGDLGRPIEDFVTKFTMALKQPAAYAEVTELTGQSMSSGDMRAGKAAWLLRRIERLDGVKWSGM